MRLAKYSCLVPALALASALTIRAQSTPTRALDVPYVPSTEDVVNGMLKLADVHKGDVVYDLGCGDGRIVIIAAKNYGARGIGVDINPERIKEATDNAKKAGVTGQVSFREGDLFTANLDGATVVTLYLLPSVNLKLKSKLLHDLKPGTRVVSHSFDMGDWKPDRQTEINGTYLYLWIIPEQKAER
ncbi:MAG: methyltransferase domain-containing protein [Bryobacteraceae bacterium]